MTGVVGTRGKVTIDQHTHDIARLPNLRKAAPGDEPSELCSDSPDVDQFTLVSVSLADGGGALRRVEG